MTLSEADQIMSNEMISILPENELQRMGINFDDLSLIRDKDGVSVWRVKTGRDSFVLKCFGKREHRREITNYQILNSLGIPTLKVIAHTDRAILLEDIETSCYRFGTDKDLSDPKAAVLIAEWYKKLHENGRKYASSHQLYDECDNITLDNITKIIDKTGTGELSVWQTVLRKFDVIKNAVMKLPRTLTYNDFYYTNLAVAREGTSALMYDYNLLGKGYIYSDIRNVCSSLSDEAKVAFLSSYGSFNVNEIIIDDVISVLFDLIVACEQDTFPSWANDSLEVLRDGRFLSAVEKLLETETGGKTSIKDM